MTQSQRLEGVVRNGERVGLDWSSTESTSKSGVGATSVEVYTDTVSVE